MEETNTISTVTAAVKHKPSFKREKAIERAIKLVWGSLESHLRYTHVRTEEGMQFHKDCVKEYSELLMILSDLY